MLDVDAHKGVSAKFGLCCRTGFQSKHPFEAKQSKVLCKYSTADATQLHHATALLKLPDVEM